MRWTIFIFLTIACGRGPAAVDSQARAPVTDAAAPGAPPAADGKHWQSFPAYPGARDFCYQHVSGNGLEIFFQEYVTSDAPETVAAFYARELKKPAEAGGRKFSFEGTNGELLDTGPLGEPGLPSCDGKPLLADKTVIVVSTGTVKP